MLCPSSASCRYVGPNSSRRTFALGCSPRPRVMIIWLVSPTRDQLISVLLPVPGPGRATYARVWRNKAAVARVLQHGQAALTLRAGAHAETQQTLESLARRPPPARPAPAGHIRRPQRSRPGPAAPAPDRRQGAARAARRGDPRVRPPAGPAQARTPGRSSSFPPALSSSTWSRSTQRTGPEVQGRRAGA